MVGYGWLSAELDFTSAKALGRHISHTGLMCKVALRKLNVMSVLAGVLKELGVW